ncbi:MAG: flagellar basal body-associated FliL family protein [Spirochaetales bacterium]|nr:flagellar basal body-associated FliL family protein [Spirochaetales bacterium]
MSDEEGLSLEDVGAGSEEIAPAGRKAGFLPIFLVRILKWVAIGLGFVILGVTTTVVTFNLVNRGRVGSELREISPEYSARPEPLNYDDTLEELRGVTSDDVPAIFSARISLGYEPGNQQLAIEIAARKREIQNIVLLYLSNKKRDQLRPERYAQIQEELKSSINRVLKEGQIEQVVFRDFVVTQ